MITSQQVKWGLIGCLFEVGMLISVGFGFDAFNNQNAAGALIVLFILSLSGAVGAGGNLLWRYVYGLRLPENRS